MKDGLGMTATFEAIPGMGHSCADLVSSVIAVVAVRKLVARIDTHSPASCFISLSFRSEQCCGSGSALSAVTRRNERLQGLPYCDAMMSGGKVQLGLRSMENSIGMVT